MMAAVAAVAYLERFLGHDLDLRLLYFLIVLCGAFLLPRLLALAVRVGDEPFRFGGDEFVLLLSDADGAGALIVAQRIQDIYRSMGQTLRGTDVEVSFSIGVAVFPEDGSTPQTLLERADEALLIAKRTGPANIVRYVERAAA